MIKCLIERGRFVAPCEFETQEQLDRFLALGREECTNENMDMELIVKAKNPGYDSKCDFPPRIYTFDYRDNFDKTEGEKHWEDGMRGGADWSHCDTVVTHVYPESVLKNAPSDFVDKRARWEASHTGKSSDVRTMRRLLHRAEQVRKDLPKVESDELSDIDKRNQFIYECAKDENLSWGDVGNEVKQKFRIMLTDKATAQAARDHRKKYKLDPLPKRNPGRKQGSIPQLDE